MKKRYLDAFFIALTGFLTILICSKSSPLYPLNDWVDANCYMTVGRAMTEGLLPYRDLFEHKGPLLYMLHAAAAMISDSSFFGVFLFEAAACIWFLYLSGSLFRRFSGNSSLWAIPFIAMTVYGSYTFCHGDSAEEFCLPLILCAFMSGLNCIESGKPLSAKDSFFIGITAGIIFWTKFNLLGYFIGMFLVLAVKSLKNGFYSIVRMCSYIVLGVGTVSLPVILYFAANNALYSLVEVYFYNNIFVYGGEKTPILRNLADGTLFTVKFLPIGSVLIIAGISAAVIRRKRTYLLYGGASLITAFLGAFAGHLSYQYYPLVLAPFTVIFGAMLIPDNVKSGKIAVPVSFVICIAGAFILSPNTYLMKYRKNQLPQYKFAEIINETDSPTLLNYGFLDGGFYLAAGIIPEQRYFCRNNLDFPAMTEAQRRCADAGLTDYIVTRSTSGKHPDFGLYTCVAHEEFPYYDKNLHYFLYKRNEGTAGAT